MAYNSESISDRLSAVRDAIAACRTSQAYTVRGRQQQMAQLRDLYAMEKDLMAQAQESADASQMCSLGRYHPE